MLLPLLTLVLALAPAQQSEDMPPLPWEPVAVIDGDPVMRGLPKDGIPPIDQPVFVRGADAAYMNDDEYVIGIVLDGTARAYSVWHLNTHEIVNDAIGSTPFVVTWCPLCFTGMVYDRRIDGRTVSFGIAGLLWRENQVMYDRETDSWWAQASGRAIRGPFEGRELVQLPASMMTWAEWLRRHPDTLVLSKRVGEGIEGQHDMYAVYHAGQSLGVTGSLRAVGLRDPKTRMAGFRIDGRPFAVDLSDFRDQPVLVSTAPGEQVVIAGGVTSGVRVFRAGRHRFLLERTDSETALVDEATRSVWDAENGVAVSGPLSGTRLDEIPTTPSYWFAWQAFFPQTIWITPAS